MIPVNLSAAEIAKIFGTSEDRIKLQLKQNAEQILHLYNKAKKTGKKVRGATEEELFNTYNRIKAKV